MNIGSEGVLLLFFFPFFLHKQNTVNSPLADTPPQGDKVKNMSSVQSTAGFTIIFVLVKFATFEITIYILGSLGFGKVQNLHLQRGWLKRTRNIF